MTTRALGYREDDAQRLVPGVFRLEPDREPLPWRTRVHLIWTSATEFEERDEVTGDLIARGSVAALVKQGEQRA